MTKLSDLYLWLGSPRGRPPRPVGGGRAWAPSALDLSVAAVVYALVRGIEHLRPSGRLRPPPDA